VTTSLPDGRGVAVLVENCPNPDGIVVDASRHALSKASVAHDQSRLLDISLSVCIWMYPRERRLTF